MKRITCNQFTDKEYSTDKRYYRIACNNMRAFNKIEKAINESDWKYTLIIQINEPIDLELATKKTRAYFSYIKQNKNKNLKYLIIPKKRNEKKYIFGYIKAEKKDFKLKYSGKNSKGLKKYSSESMNLKIGKTTFTNIANNEKEKKDFLLNTIGKNIDIINKHRYYFSNNT